ncbi:5'-3' exonuclease [Pseudarthrobacter chlorophenolicus A6]|uniref:5'-3' exonuclease n=1 Tax=Pseudarthrobacter chlorophenolicus (strain ATCC 700700 / DSM 12829 / CIP 107037 / JCM 12360 / KCTC 9906 / NCIMB 13794 / A6) TaxID=452863 RepID=B8H7H3_PSECP|nr:5'-3' exonuclease [Pseudarthrobacter chlorophenolicus]ACL39753.1 5'-3' exonuclease [Pseudarthrobacter chlorophenolicus A6]SDQ94298.1 5'-3' exonuclease [Pseudarthrobacter chlorophenolicus]
MPQRLMLLDTASLYFRAFYGLPDTIRRPDGTPVNAVRGLLDMIARLTTDYHATHLVACWDDDWRPQWRVDLVPTYKAHRVAEANPGGTDVEVVPDALEAQLPMIRKALELAGIAIVGAADHEADDVIGTYASHADMPVDVVTGDRDLFQVCDDERQVRVIYTARGMRNLEVCTEETIVAKYKVLPQQYADYATLRGDASDGLPGVAGIGEKTAASLLLKYGTLDALLAAAETPDGGVSAPVRAKLSAAAAYLEAAPAVVRLVRDLQLPAVEEAGAMLEPVAGDRRAELERIATDWNLGGSVRRLLDALDLRGQPG